uniref:Uncharacterized protein n=1 Tax=viral metagenome TaxID=1070528 RepID=A0A6C0CYX6_9ZZZZ
MKSNELLMVILAFFLGFMCSDMMKNICDNQLVEGVDNNSNQSSEIDYLITMFVLMISIGVMVALVIAGLPSKSRVETNPVTDQVTGVSTESGS